ncbi:uncharacterized protein TNCV_3771131 [Trichonephila clavipes]|nr:uncharacterized protein TNCV_3771131 [Trichonephila clavipes]
MANLGHQSLRPTNLGRVDEAIVPQYSRGFMVWTGIPLDDRRHRYVYARGTVTAVRYRDEVLEPCVRLFTGAVSPDLNLMNDIAREAHRIHLVDEFLESGHGNLEFMVMEFRLACQEFKLKCHAERLMHVKSVKAQSPPVGIA